MATFFIIADALSDFDAYAGEVGTSSFCVGGVAGAAQADDLPPAVSNRDPAPNEPAVELSTSISFDVTDNVAVDLPELQVTIRRGTAPIEQAVIDGVIQPAYAGTGSGIVSIAGGYHVALVPLLALSENVIVTVTVYAFDTFGNSTISAWTFDTIGLEAVPVPFALMTVPDFPLSMYRFIIREIRTKDLTEGDLFLKRFLAGPDQIWQDTIARTLSIPGIWNIDTVDASFLTFLKNIVGWTDAGLTKRITDTLDLETLRRLIAVSGRLWRERGPETTILDVLQLLTRARCRIWNWFDFRWVLDETELGEEHQGRDPWIINLPAQLIDVGPPPVYTTDEYRSNLRIVDNGDLDRTLVKRILRLMRAAGERFEITYLAFMDLFLVDADDVQWNRVAASLLVVQDGTMRLPDPTIAQDTYAIVQGATIWSQYVYTARIRGASAAPNARFGVTFYRTDADNFYEAVIDTASQELRLRKTVAGAVTNLVTVNLTLAAVNIYANTYYALRVSTVQEGATNRIVVFVDGASLINTTDPDLIEGAVGVRHDVGATIEVDEVEVLALPSQADSLELIDNP